MLGDPKMTRLSSAEKWYWVGILLLAGQSPIRGRLMLTDAEPMSIEDIAAALSLPREEVPVLENCIAKLEALGSIRRNNVCLEVIHFKDRQEVYESDFKDYHKGESNKLRINSELTPKKVLKEEEERGERQKKESSPNGEDILAQKKSRFDLFWKAYPKKRNKGQAERAFKKAAPDEQLMAAILTAIERAKKSAQWLKDDGQFIPYPATWLNAKGWEDEFPENESQPGQRYPPRRKAGKVPSKAELDEQERRYFGERQNGHARRV